MIAFAAFLLSVFQYCSTIISVSLIFEIVHRDIQSPSPVLNSILFIFSQLPQHPQLPNLPSFQISTSSLLSRLGVGEKSQSSPEEPVVYQNERGGEEIRDLITQPNETDPPVC